MRPSCKLNENTWSINGLLFGWFFGVLNTYTNISFTSFKCAVLSNPPSKESNGLEYFRQLPVSLSSSVVWMLLTKNLSDGPLGLLHTHINRSFCLCCSKNKRLLHERSKHKSEMVSFASFLSTLDSVLVLGIKSIKSFTRWRILPLMPLEHTINVLCLFFHSRVCGSGSLNALS